MDLYPLADLPAGEQGELIVFLRETFVTRSRDQWVEWFADKDDAFSPVLDFREALSEPHVAERGLWIEYEGARQLAPAIRFAGEVWSPSGAPELGASG
jgi:crotonobetainyl-CoA:carnitine CoA-transferase CaiB-like acyl-CoA transferase